MKNLLLLEVRWVCCGIPAEYRGYAHYKTNYRMNINAISVSSYVASTLDSLCNIHGQIVQVLRGCINWVTHEGELLCISAKSTGSFPHGIIIADEAFSSVRLLAEEPVIVKGQVITLGTEGLAIDTSNAQICSLTLIRVSGLTWRKTCIDEAIAELSKSVSTRGAAHLLPLLHRLTDGQPCTSNGSLLESHLIKAMQALSSSIKRQNPIAFLEAAQNLVGAGVGLTPSGDDILLGVIACLRCTENNNDSENWFLPAFADLRRKMIGWSTQVSETFLYHALSGRFPERLLDLLHALNKSDIRAIKTSAEALTFLGKTSGREMALGLFLAYMSRAY